MTAMTRQKKLKAPFIIFWKQTIVTIAFNNSFLALNVDAWIEQNLLEYQSDQILISLKLNASLRWFISLCPAISSLINNLSAFFKKMGLSRPLFLYFRLFNTVDSKMFNINFLPMTGFEPRTSEIGSDRSTNWATTTAHLLIVAYNIRPEWSSESLSKKSFSIVIKRQKWCPIMDIAWEQQHHHSVRIVFNEKLM